MPITFLNLAMLAGLAAIALPPIIHLLTRKKFDIEPWAAMQFLDLGKRTRRRMIWDEVLLMAVRMGVIAFLVLALAVPKETAGWLARFHSGGDRDIVLILDRSESTGVGISQSAIPQWATKFVDSLGARDRLAVIEAGAIPRTLVPLDADRDAVSSALHSLRTPRGSCDGPAAIAVAMQMLADWPTAKRYVVVVTDGQRHGWTDDAAMSRWEALAQPSSKSLPPLSIARVALDRRADLPRWTLEPMRVARSLVAVDQPMTIRSELKRLGAGDLPMPTVLVEFDGQPASRIEMKSTSGALAHPIEAQKSFATAGSHLATLRLVAADNSELDRQDLAIEVVPNLPVLIVDGDQRGGPRRHGVEFVREALAPARDPKPSVVTRVIPITNFSAEMLDRDLGGTDSKPRVLVFMDAPRLSNEQSAAVDRFLEAGGGVLVTLGERADAGQYSREFFRAGRGWLPAGVGDMAGPGDPSKSPSPLTAGFQHPALELFRKPGAGTLSEARMPRWRSLIPAPNAATIARLDGDIPWLVEGSRGTGRVIVSAIPLDDSNRTNLVELPAFAPLMHELVAYLALTRANETALSVGQPFVWTLPKPVPTDGWELIDPLSNSRPVKVTDGRIAIRETFDSGPFALKNSRAATRYFVIRADSKERDLTKISDAERERIDALWPGVRWDMNPPQAAVDSAQAAVATNLGWIAFVGVIGLLCFELWMTRRRALAAV